MKDLESRLATRVQLTTDGFRPYLTAVEDAFAANIDYAMLVKVYSQDESKRERYSPSGIVDAVSIPVTVNPKASRISTSHVERQISRCGCNSADSRASPMHFQKS